MAKKTTIPQMTPEGREARYVNRMAAAGSNKSPSELKAEFKAKTSKAPTARNLARIEADLKSLKSAELKDVMRAVYPKGSRGLSRMKVAELRTTLVGAHMAGLNVPEAVAKIKGATVGGSMASGAKALAKGVGKAGLKALGPIAAFAAAASMFRSSAEAGENKAVSAAKAVGAGIDSFATAGLLTTMVTDPKVQAEVAKQRAQPRGARGSAPALTAPDSMQHLGSVAKSVFVSAIGSAMAADAKKDLIAQKAAKAAGQAYPLADRVIARGARGLGLFAKYGGGTAAIATTADLLISGAKADDGSKGAADGGHDFIAGVAKELVNPTTWGAAVGGAMMGKSAGGKLAATAGLKLLADAVIVPMITPRSAKADDARGMSSADKAKYAEASKNHAAKRDAAAAEAPKSDGWTDPYVRSQNGKTIKVGGYKTVIP